MNRSPIHKRVRSLFLSISLVFSIFSLDTLGIRAVTITDDSSNVKPDGNSARQIGVF